KPEAKAKPEADTTAPQIKLKGGSSVQLDAGEIYVEPGASAWDNRDGNITRRIRISGKVDTSRTGTYMIKYSVRDKAGNSAHASRFVTVVSVPDTTSPVITLNGDSSVTVIEDGNYIDAGAKAVDDVDGDVSADIQRTGLVNMARTGSYTLKYDVSDAAGNAAVTKVRIVKVVDRGDPEAGRQVAMKKCKTCHNLDSAKNKFGPGLKGIFNQKAGRVAGYKYSSTLGVGSWKWDKASLRVWLSQRSRDAVKQLSGDPDAFTKMKFKGVSGSDLDNLITFLKGN
ncbi:MAG: immunoglobulin-like domain-containing protein, partial [Mariprofundus sp.]